jgi:large subunit ribosomal protein L1
MPKLSKRLAGLASKIEDRVYEPLEAIALVKDNATAKFD